MAGKVEAFEYSTRDGRARGWLVPCSRDGQLVTGYAVLIPGLRDLCSYPAPWLVEVKYAGRFGHRASARRKTLTGARVWALGGNGHVHRGSTSIVASGRMSRPNILALAAG